LRRQVAARLDDTEHAPTANFGLTPGALLSTIAGVRNLNLSAQGEQDEANHNPLGSLGDVSCRRV
jgi:hypothetical protein